MADIKRKIIPEIRSINRKQAITNRVAFESLPV